MDVSGTKEWFTLTELQQCALPGMPASPRALALQAEHERWRFVEGKARRAARKGGGWEYHFTLLPASAQAKLMMIHSAPANDDKDIAADRRQALWARYEALPDDQKQIAQARLLAVKQASELMQHGYTAVAAAATSAKKAQVSARTIFNWQELCAHTRRDDWLAALAPSFNTDRDFAECHPDAWDAIKSDYLRPEKPSFSACFRRVASAAKSHGWAPPCGWNCRCTLQSLSERDVERLRGELTFEPPADDFFTWTNKSTGEIVMIPTGIDPGWDHNPGKISAMAVAQHALTEKAAKLRNLIGTLPGRPG